MTVYLVYYDTARVGRRWLGNTRTGWAWVDRETATRFTSRRQAETGRLTVGLRLPADDPNHVPIAAVLNPALLTVLSATAGIMGVLLLGTPGGPRVTDQVSLYTFLSYILLIVSAVLGMRVLALIFRRNT